VRKSRRPYWLVLDNDDLEEGNKVDELSSDDEDNSAVISPPISVSPSLIATSITPVKSSNTVDDHISSKYPHLSRALGDNDGYFDPADPTIVKLMQGLLQEINHLLSKNYELNVCVLTLNKQISYV
jgi:hypothetical protein